VDESNNSKAAFFMAISMMLNKSVDHLYILTVVRKSRPFYPRTRVLQDHVLHALYEHKKQTAKELLLRYSRLAKTYGLKYSPILAMSNHTGEMICHQAKEKNIDLIVMGRRGMNRIKRLVVGSNSRYVMEHADCNVMMIRGEWTASDDQEVKKATTEGKEERQIKEGEKALESHGHAHESLDLDDVLDRETEEMANTEKKAVKEKASKHKEAAHTGQTLAAQEKEDEKQRADDTSQHMEVVEKDFD